jgi:hypothetical protein
LEGEKMVEEVDGPRRVRSAWRGLPHDRFVLRGDGGAGVFGGLPLYRVSVADLAARKDVRKVMLYHGR